MKSDDLDLIYRYYDGELDGEQRAAFERRLESEPDLQSGLDELQSLDSLADSLEKFSAPEVDFSRGTVFPEDRQYKWIGKFLAGAAAAAACLLIGIGIGGRLSTPPATPAKLEVFNMVYYAPDAGSVSMIGDFNGWSGEIPLKPKGQGGYWLAEVEVKPGEYRYVLIVDGERRPGDPLADYVIDDDFGSKNSVVRIGL